MAFICGHGWGGRQGPSKRATRPPSAARGTGPPPSNWLKKTSLPAGWEQTQRCPQHSLPPLTRPAHTPAKLQALQGSGYRRPSRLGRPGNPCGQAAPPPCSECSSLSGQATPSPGEKRRFSFPAAGTWGGGAHRRAGTGLRVSAHLSVHPSGFPCWPGSRYSLHPPAHGLTTGSTPTGVLRCLVASDSPLAGRT